MGDAKDEQQNARSWGQRHAPILEQHERPPRIESAQFVKSGDLPAIEGFLTGGHLT
jgi:hypothetical protein